MIPNSQHPRSRPPGRARRAGLRMIAALTLALSMLPAIAGSRLTGTGGVSQIEGAAGGGLSPWALIAGYGTRDEIGASAFATRLRTQGAFTLESAGAAIGLYNRLELSFARQRFGLGTTVPGQSIRLDTVGLKLRVFGDALYDQDSIWPQIAIGLQHKDNRDFDAVPAALGASAHSGTDVYVAASKLWLGGAFGHNVLANLTLRHTRANQFGLLGFGGPQGGGARIMPELSGAFFVNDRLAIGAEYRRKPDQLASFGEQSAQDLFIVWFPLRWISITLAQAQLGRIADKPAQRAWYLSLGLTY